MRSDSVKKTAPTDNWYAICTRPRAEKKVFERLTSRGYQAYLPLVTSMKIWSDRKKKVQSPLISSYVFVKINKENLYDTMNIQGTWGVLRYLGKPAVVKEHEIENLKILLNDSQLVTKFDDVKFEKGEEIEVIHGSFTGLIAQIVRVQGSQKIVVEIEALGSMMSVVIPLAFTKKRYS